jgi:AcrR family transcriptional regulator
MADRAASAQPRESRATRGERTRQRLLDAAREAFCGVAWTRARVEDVCRVAGVGHGTFYAYFANKTAVLEALVHRHAAALYGLAEGPWTGGDLAGDVRRVIAGFVDLSAQDRDIREMWYAAAPSEPSLARLVDEVREQFVRRIEASLTAALDAGQARAGLDAEVAALALAAMVDQTVVLASGRVARDRLVSTLADLWVHAVYR